MTEEPGPAYTRLDVAFNSGNAKCAGWLYLPKHASADHPVPAVAMAPGLGWLKEMGLSPVAEALAAAGVAVLLFDYRFYGASGGQPREQVIPYEQVQDYRNGLTFLSLRSEVDEARLGVWGVSFSGGHVLDVGAYDKRVKAVVAVTPATDAYAGGQRRFSEEVIAMFTAAFAEERKRLQRGGEPLYVPLAAPNNEGGALMGTECNAWQERYRTTTAPLFVNRITLDSLQRVGEYAPGLSVARIAPAPLLVVLARQDAVVEPEVTLETFEHAGEPKELLELDCGHYDMYEGEAHRRAIEAAVSWFRRHLF